MISKAVGLLRSRVASAMSKAPPPPKPAAEMNLIEMADYNKIGGTISKDRWWLFTWFVMVPLTCAAAWNAYKLEMDHLKHDPPAYIPYDHINNRPKVWPWGDGEHSLFHSSRANAIPGKGYEWQVSEAEE